MATTIAISGKGGSGKTTLAAMIIRELAGLSGKSVLAVDADPNSCLAMTLGAEVTNTISSIRENARAKTDTTAGMDRARSFEYGIQQAVTEADGYDLLTMGQPEGPSCYCAANNMLRKFMDQLSSTYSFVVMDNEAGMEHLSRRTTNDVDLLLMVAQQTPIGRVTAQRIYQLTKSLPIKIKSSGLIWNQTDSAQSLDGIDILGSVPLDPAVQDACSQGKTVFDLPEDTPALVAVREILKEKLDIKKT